MKKKKKKKKKSIPVCASISFWKEPHFYEINYESLSLFHANVYVKKKEKKKKDAWLMKASPEQWILFPNELEIHKR